MRPTRCLAGLRCAAQQVAQSAQQCLHLFGRQHRRFNQVRRASGRSIRGVALEQLLNVVQRGHDHGKGIQSHHNSKSPNPFGHCWE